MLIEFQNKPNEYISLLSLYYSGLWITHIIIMLIYNIFEYMHDLLFCKILFIFIIMPYDHLLILIDDVYTSGHNNDREGRRD